MADESGEQLELIEKGSKGEKHRPQSSSGGPVYYDGGDSITSKPTQLTRQDIIRILQEEGVMFEPRKNAPPPRTSIGEPIYYEEEPQPLANRTNPLTKEEIVKILREQGVLPVQKRRPFCIKALRIIMGTLVVLGLVSIAINFLLDLKRHQTIEKQVFLLRSFARLFAVRIIRIT